MRAESGRGVQVSVRIRGWWDDLRDSLWLIRAASVLTAAVLAGVMRRFEPLVGADGDRFSARQRVRQVLPS